MVVHGMVKTIDTKNDSISYQETLILMARLVSEVLFQHKLRKDK